ncbi:MAG: DNA polymerase IV [Candidatus Kaiserbacteria bacterium]|nr:MAG: DNA polymerase IV [Candidatus Kaiserbacteria bacterium]
MWNEPRSFPRAILHIDGDSFFASCEVARNPKLRGKPVITGKERGIVSACTYEAKRRGVKRGVSLSEALKACPDAIVLPSDYETYSLYSARMYEIVRRYTPSVEEYSIDECFADLTGLRHRHRMSYQKIAAAIQRDLTRELDITFSIGLSCTKVLSKIGSKWQKPAGFTVIPLTEAERYLQKTPCVKVWGIGHNTAAYLEKFGVHTALDLARKDEPWVRAKLSKPFFELWRELRGEVVFELDTKGRESYQSIQKTKTFTPPSRDPQFVCAQLSKNVENACIKARRWNLATSHIFFFLKTQDFHYHGFEIKLPHSTSVPQDMLREISRFFPHVWQPRTLYRATGITLYKLHRNDSTQLDLFGAVHKSEGLRKVYESVDAISERYGKHSVFLGSSFAAMKYGAHLGTRGDTPERLKHLFKGETKRRHLPLPVLGEVG